MIGDRAERGDASAAEAENILLGLRLRGWLTAQDMETLDRLAPEPAISFLLAGERFLHPRDVELFPPNLIGTAAQQGEAIFSHRFRPLSDNTEHCYTVQTAVINAGGPDPYIIGHMSPGYRIRQANVDNHFATLATVFRAAYETTSALMETLTARLESPEPVIIINRASGRIVQVNAQAAEQLDKDPHDLAGCEYRDVKAALSREICGTKVTLQNLSAGETHLSVMALGTGTSSGK